MIIEQSKTIYNLDKCLKKLKKQSNKTSTTISLPPQPNGYKKTKSLREPSNKILGDQYKHKEYIFKMVATPDVIIKHNSTDCQGYNYNLKNIKPENPKYLTY